MNRTAAEARHAMLAAFGHELRAPLARILHLSQEGGTGEAIAACARQQLELIDDLLDYTRGQVRPAELVAAPTYLHALMHQVADEAEALARSAGCALLLRVGENVPPLAVLDARRLRQMLRKLALRAAHRATATGGVHAAAGQGEPQAADGAPRIVLALDAVSSSPAAPPPAVMLRFSVALSGGAVFGLSEWLPFGDDAQAPAGDENRADALGLALAAQLARGMQTILETCAGPDGPEIFFNLQTTTATESEAMLPQAGFDPAPSAEGGRLLLLDTQPAMLDYLTEMLDGAGFDVDCAASVEAALARQRAAPADLIVCAHQPPGLDVRALLERLRAAGDPVPVILHALAPLPAPDRAGGAAPAAVLYRPASALVLLKAIRAALAPGARR